MSIFTMVNGAWHECPSGQATKVKIGGTWRQVTQCYTKINGVWVSTWSLSTPGSWQSGVPGTYVIGPITSTTVTATVIAGGGGGNHYQYNNGGGSGGWYYQYSFTVPAGSSLIATVGAGGAGTTNSWAGNGTGSALSRNGVTILSTTGGQGGRGSEGAGLAGSPNGQNGGGIGAGYGAACTCPVYGGAQQNNSDTAGNNYGGGGGPGGNGAPGFIKVTW